MATNYPINPRVRAFGKARLDIAGRAKSQAQWEKLWKHPANSFPFVWGESWKQCIEYRVDDFPAEVGFYIDILSLPINALDPGYAMFTSPQADFFFSVVPTPHNEQSTPPDAFRLQFMVKDILATTHELQQRGIDFDLIPQPLHPGSSLSTASFRTPHGICVELWGRVESGISSDARMSLSKDQKDGDEQEKGDDKFKGDEEPDNADEDEFDEDEDDGDLESDEKIGEDSDGDDLGEDLDDDNDGDEFDEDDDEFNEDDDDDEDDYDGDEDITAQESGPRISVTGTNPTLPVDSKLRPSYKMAGHQQEQGPEYIDLDIT